MTVLGGAGTRQSSAGQNEMSRKISSGLYVDGAERERAGALYEYSSVRQAVECDESAGAKRHKEKVVTIGSYLYCI